MGMTSTYTNRANTNQRLLAAASDAAFPNPANTRKVLPFSKYHEAPGETSCSRAGLRKQIIIAVMA